MKNAIWQPTSPMHAIVFDCDGTLSQIEGIDELARMNGASVEVEKLTAQAMNQTGLNPNLYAHRLALVKPNQQQLLVLGEQYYAQKTPDAENVIAIFKRLKKAIYIMSAGLYQSVVVFADLLGIQREHVFAVNTFLDKDGKYLDFDHASPLIFNDGKRQLVKELKKRHRNLIYVGDGVNDLSTIDTVTRFIGYGGVFYRENIAVRSHQYIKTASLTPLLPLCLTTKEAEKLSAEEKRLYQIGLDAIHAENVIHN